MRSCRRAGVDGRVGFARRVGGGAQQTGAGFNENVVFLDAAHGGTDAGAHLGGTVDEKDVTLALAGRVKSALAAKGFYVVMSRDGDATVTAEQRAGVANHARPLACVLLHASSSGSGPGAVLAVSALTPDGEQRVPSAWATAQASYVSESLALQEMMAGALASRKVKPIAMRASTPPIDSLTCAAVTVEMLGSGASEEGSQQKVADAVTQALVAWKAQVAPAKVVPGASGRAAAPDAGAAGAKP